MKNNEEERSERQVVDKMATRQDESGDAPRVACELGESEYMKNKIFGYFGRDFLRGKLPKLRKIPIKRRSLCDPPSPTSPNGVPPQSTRSIPFTQAENITKNSLVSLSDLISEVDFSPRHSPNLPWVPRVPPHQRIRVLLREHRNPCSEIEGFLRPNEFFLSENANILKMLTRFLRSWLRKRSSGRAKVRRRSFYPQGSLEMRNV
ncbi:hypothetical protein Syun_004752 [Stephania yunnanensis]|uniref:Uncharacterized protein n=1 Tax=Stephania yunnanensis TaxID=152371 RepID=A0AAP0L4J8_9MAGN